VNIKPADVVSLVAAGTAGSTLILKRAEKGLGTAPLRIAGKSGNTDWVMLLKFSADFVFAAVVVFPWVTNLLRFGNNAFECRTDVRGRTVSIPSTCIRHTSPRIVVIVPRATVFARTALFAIGTGTKVVVTTLGMTSRKAEFLIALRWP